MISEDFFQDGRKAYWLANKYTLYGVLIAWEYAAELLTADEAMALTNEFRQMIDDKLQEKERTQPGFIELWHEKRKNWRS